MELIDLPPVVVGPVSYTVVETDPWDDESMGKCIEPLCRIAVREDATDGQKRDTVLHEVLHAITYQDPLWRSHDDNENVSMLSSAILDVLRRNPELVSFLMEDLDEWATEEESPNE